MNTPLRKRYETDLSDAQAEAIMAKAEAEALNLKKQYATMELIWLSAVEKWDGKLPTHLLGVPPTPVLEMGN